MENIALFVGVASAIIGTIGGYTVIIYKIATLMSIINRNVTITEDVHRIVLKQEERITDIDQRLLVIETQHKMNHGKE